MDAKVIKIHEIATYKIIIIIFLLKKLTTNNQDVQKKLYLCMPKEKL